MRRSFSTTFNVLTIAVCTIALISCEGNTRLEWNLQNLSSEDVYVIHKAWDYSAIPPDTLVVLTGETYMLGLNDVLGGNATPWAPASFIDTLFITSASGALCTKDWTETDEWGIVSQEERKIPSNWSHTYFFRVEDSDF